jgi:TonB family protein
MTLTAKDSLETNAAGKQGEDSQNSVSNPGESTRSNPVCLEVGVTIRSLPSEAGGVAKPLREEVRTVIVFDNGAVLRCPVNLPIGLTIILTGPSKRDVVCRVVGGRNLPTVKGYMEVQFIEAVSDFWSIHEESTPAVAAPPLIVQPVRPEPTAPPRTPAPSRASAIPETPLKPANKSQDSAPSFDDIGGLTSTPVSTAPRYSKTGPDRPSPELAAKGAGYSHAETSKPTSLANWNLSELDSPATKETSAAISSTLAPAQSRDFMSKGLMAYEKPSPSSSSASSRMPMIVGAAVLALAAVGGVALFMRGSAAPASAPQRSVASQPSTSAQPSSGAPESAGAAQISAAQEAAGAQPSAQPVAMEQAQPAIAITPTPAVVIASASNDSRADQQKVRLSEQNSVVAKKSEASTVRRPAMPNLKISSPSAPKRNNSDSNGGVAPSTEIAMAEPVGAVSSAGLLTSGGRTSSAPLPPTSLSVPAPLVQAPVAAAKAVSEPKLISSSKVSYPVSAKQANIQGTVTLSLTIDERGNVIGAKALNGPLLLRQAAADSVKLWKYSPGLLDGKPAPSQVTVSLDFKLN